MTPFLRSLAPLLAAAYLFTLGSISAQSLPARPDDADVQDKPFTNTLGMQFVPVPIPGGKPVLFCIWKTRVRDFAAFVNDTGYDATEGMGSDDPFGNFGHRGDTWMKPGFDQTPEHPVCGVSFEDALAFCEWLSKKEGIKYRLPTDHEWSCAVGIGDREDASDTPKEKAWGAKKIEGVYPWGVQWPPPKGAGNYQGEEREFHLPPGSPLKGIEGYRDKFVCTSPVGSFDANKLGLYDLGGNLWEWCDTDFDGTGKTKALRGASWLDKEPASLLSSFRLKDEPTDRIHRVGFRCVADGEPAAEASTNLIDQLVLTIREPTVFRESDRSRPVPLGNIYIVEEQDATGLRMRGQTGRVDPADVIALVDAVDYFTELVNANPSPINYYNRSLARLMWGEFDDAISDLNEAIRLDPANPRFFNKRGVLWDMTLIYDKAADDYSEAIKLDPTFADAFYNRGVTLAKGREPDKALLDFTEAIRLKPWNADVYVERGMLHQRGGRLNEAMVDFDKAIEINPKLASAYYNRATLWQTNSEDQKALTDFNEAIRLNPGNHNYFVARGDSWRRLGSDNKALADYAEAIRLDPKDYVAYGHRGYVLYRQGKYDEAIADLDKATDLDDFNATAFYHRGRAYKAKGNYEQALADFDEAMATDPFDASSFEMAAWVRATCPEEKFLDGEKAIELAKKAIEISKTPTYSELETLAAAYAEAGDFAKAVETQIKVREMGGDSMKARANIFLELYEARKPCREVPVQ